MAPERRAPSLETVRFSKSFGPLVALDEVSISVAAGSFHALLGENGAGKSTLVKCVTGFETADGGVLRFGGEVARVASPRDAQALGIGMVYQHFTLVPCLTAAENLVIARADTPAVIDWRRERARLGAFMERMPFRAPLDARVADLSAGEKQKLEILKLLYLDQRFLILDEPTSVLTPAEADEVLGLLGGMARAGEVTVLMISHKFREVKAFCDSFTVLRRGRVTGAGDARTASVAELGAMMVGSAPPRAAAARAPTAGETVLRLTDVAALGAEGRRLLDGVSLSVRAGEILGVAGISGNGQGALVEVLSGQRPLAGGEMTVDGAPFRATRADMDRFRVRGLPEEPLRNAAVGRMSVCENLAFRRFDKPPVAGRLGLLSPGTMRRRAAALIEEFRIRTPSPDAPAETLSGGNLQRMVLARELSEEVRLLVCANPCFGLDFASVADIRARLMAARNAGAAVLLVSEDLDEIFEMADRIAVMSAGRVVFVSPSQATDRAIVGRHMAGSGAAAQVSPACDPPR